jgi:hypothetical protein
LDARWNGEHGIDDAIPLNARAVKARAQGRLSRSANRAAMPRRDDKQQRHGGTVLSLRSS